MRRIDLEKVADDSTIFNQSNVTGAFSYVYDLTGISNVALAITHTPVSAGTGTLSLSASNDGVNFAAIPGTTVSITAAGTTILSVLNPAYKFIQVNYAATANGMNLVGVVTARS